MSAKLFVSNLAFDVTEKELAEFFSIAGDVADVHLFRRNGRATGQAIVRMGDANAAEAALALDRRPHGGRVLLLRRWIDLAQRPLGPVII